MLLNDSDLIDLSNEFHVLDGEIPCLIRLLQQLREFQANIKFLPSSYRTQQLLKIGCDIDNMLACEILQYLGKLAKAA